MGALLWGLTVGPWAFCQSQIPDITSAKNGKLPSPQKSDSLIDTLEMTPLYKTRRGRESPFLSGALSAWGWKALVPPESIGGGFSATAGHFKLPFFSGA